MVVRVRLIAWGGRVDPSRAVGSRRVWDERRGLLLVLEDASGARGFGEATPLPGLSAESIEDVGASLVRVSWSRLDPRQVAAGAARRGELAALSPSARFAVETACVDLVGLITRRSAATLLGAPPNVAPVPVNALIGRALAPDLVERARQALARGASVLKVKLAGHDLDAELAALRAVRDAVGPQVRIRVDLGGALSQAEALRWLLVIANARVEAVEEPCGGAALVTLGRGAIPWLADESLASPAIGEALVESQGCGGLVLKPTLLGGLFSCLELARRAREKNKAVTITHAFEGPVGLAACAALALAAGADLAGLDDHAALAAFPAWRTAMLSGERPLAVRPTESPGLGLAGIVPAFFAQSGTVLWQR